MPDSQTLASVPDTAAAVAAALPAGDGFLPHGFCFLWNRPLLWTHVVSDVLIGLSYVVIAATLVHFIHKARRDLPFSYVFLAFGLFIVACGGTHFMEVWTFWQPVYWLSGAVKVVTAVASVSTAAVLPFTVPKIHFTIREAKLAREREKAAARAAALEESNALLRDQAAELETQATELEEQREQAVQLAQQLRKANAQLEGLNASLQQALGEARTAQQVAVEARQAAEAAQRVAEEANAAKRDFLAVMSHELRTPLQAVIGYADLLQLGVSGPVTTAQGEQLGRIRSSAHHLVSLIDQILTFTRLEAGAEPLHTAAFDLRGVLEQAAAMARPLAMARGLALRVDAPAVGAATMVSDARSVRQVLLNLLTNAVKYTPAGQVTLPARVESPGSVEPRTRVAPPAGAGDAGVAAEAPEPMVVVQVADTGIGIAPEHQARIFDPFWQVAPALTREVGGTGLGLSVTRDLVRALGGTLAVASVPGAGSTFTVRLPLASPGAPAVGNRP
jgi:signal transduction histidine kinase